MAKELVSDELWNTLEPLLPEEPPKPQGGRPRVDDRAALAVKRGRIGRLEIEELEVGRLHVRELVVEQEQRPVAEQEQPPPPAPQDPQESE